MSDILEALQVAALKKDGPGDDLADAGPLPA
jgi:hypothetical protein